jgi:hypothetical protein
MSPVTLTSSQILNDLGAGGSGLSIETIYGGSGTVSDQGGSWQITPAQGFIDGDETFSVDLSDGQVGSIVLYVGGNGAIISDYELILNRAPSGSEYAFYANSGESNAQTQIYMFASQEFFNDYGISSSGVVPLSEQDQVVSLLYTAAFGSVTTAEINTAETELGADHESWITVESGVLDSPGADPLVIGAPGTGLPTLESIAAGTDFNDGSQGDAPTGWTAGGSGFLVAVSSGGDITQISQMLPDPGNPSAANSFTALSQYAVNGVIQPGDAGYSEIEVWVDPSGQAGGGEIYSLASLGIASISAVPTVAVLDDSGNLVTLESTYTTTSGQTGYIVRPPSPMAGRTSRSRPAPRPAPPSPTTIPGRRWCWAMAGRTVLPPAAATCCWTAMAASTSSPTMAAATTTSMADRATAR